MLHYILQVVLFQLVFLLMYEFLLKKETFFTYNRWYLLVTPVVALILPLLKFEPLGAWVPTENLVMLPEVILGETTETSVSQTTLASSSNFFQMNWWLVAYFSGLIFSLVLFLRKYFDLRKMFRFKIVSEEKGIKIIEVPNSNLACTFFNTVFLGSELKSEEKQHVLAHEMVHVSQKHSWDLIFFEVLKAFFWFNPLIYIFQHKIAALHEFIADAQVIKTTERKTYYHQLLNTAFDTQNISFTNQFFKGSLIKKRIVMLQKSKSKSVGRLKYLLLLPLLLLMLTYVSCSEDNSEIVASETTEKTTISKKLDEIKSIMQNGTELTDEEKRKMSEIVQSINKEFVVGSKIATRSAKGLIENAVPFSVIEKAPIFPGCENLTSNKAKKGCMSTKIREFVDANFKKEEMKVFSKKGINRIYVQFKISTSGEVIDVKARASSPQLQAEAKRVVSLLPQMVPGKQDGKKVGALYSLPIIFKVDE